MKRMVLIPEEKLLQYEQQQEGLTNAQDKGERNVSSEQGEERKELSDDIIVRGIPKTMKTRAIALLERLKARPDVISWDDMGQVKIDGTLIPKSNISDLISSAMRSRKYFDPVASQEVFNVLSNLNVPKDLVRNEEGWKKVTQKGEGEDWAGLWDFMKPIVTSRKKRGKVFREMGRSLKTYGQKGKGEDWGGFWDSVKSGEALREMKRLMGPTIRRGKVLSKMVPLKTYGRKGKREDRTGFWDLVKGGEALVKDGKTLREMKRLMGTAVRTSIYKGGQKGKGGLISPGAWYQMGETSQKGTGKRKRSQEGGFAFGPYTQGLSGIERKRRAPQKLRKVPKWEHYKG